MGTLGGKGLKLVPIFAVWLQLKLAVLHFHQTMKLRACGHWSEHIENFL